MTMTKPTTIRPGDPVRVYSGPHYGRIHRVVQTDVGPLRAVRVRHGDAQLDVPRCDVDPTSEARR